MQQRFGEEMQQSNNFFDESNNAPATTTVVVAEPPAAPAPQQKQPARKTFAATLLAKKRAQAENTPVVPKKRRTRRKPPQQRLPRDKALYAMRALQASSKPIFPNLTVYRIVKTYTREVLKRPKIKYSKKAMTALVRIVEVMLNERLLLAHAICLQAGRKTLMLHHLKTAEHYIRKPNLAHWNVPDFEEEEKTLEPSRFRDSRLSQS